MLPSRMSRMCYARARTLHTTALCGAGRHEESNGSVTYELKGRKASRPYNERVSASATIDEINEKDAAFDPKTVDPKQEMQNMKDEDEHHESLLEWSGANELASPQSPSKK